jgi:hypothetical protein
LFRCSGRQRAKLRWKLEAVIVPGMANPFSKAATIASTA